MLLFLDLSRRVILIVVSLIISVMALSNELCFDDVPLYYSFLSDGSCIKYKVLDDDHYSQIILDTTKIDLSDQYSLEGLTIYKFKNLIIVKDEFNVVMYYSEVDYNKVLDDYSEDGLEILNGLNVYNELFPERINDIIINLFGNLNLPIPSKIEVSHLNLIDSIINSKEDSVLEVRKNFMGIIAVIGELINQKKGTSWKMILSDDNKTWNPYLILGNDEISFFEYIYEDVFVDFNELSTYEVYHTVLDIIYYNF